MRRGSSEGLTGTLTALSCKVWLPRDLRLYYGMALSHDDPIAMLLANYPDRMRMPMVMEFYVSDHFHIRHIKNFAKILFIAEWDGIFVPPFMPYGMWWKKYRRAFQEYFYANEFYKCIPIQRQEIHAFLHWPFVATDVQGSNDPYILAAEEAMKRISETDVPGAFWVEVYTT